MYAGWRLIIKRIYRDYIFPSRGGERKEKERGNTAFRRLQGILHEPMEREHLARKVLRRPQTTSGRIQLRPLRDSRHKTEDSRLPPVQATPIRRYRHTRGSMHAAGSTAYAGVSAGTIPGATGERFVFESWGGDASGSDYAQSDAITMNAPKTATANWQTQYYFTINSAHDSPTSSSWVDAGTDFEASVSSPADTVPSVSRWVCSGYRVDSGSLNSSTTCTLSAVSAPHTVLFEWIQQFHLTVQTDPSGLSPLPSVAPSGQWFNNGTLVTLTAQSISDYVFDHWVVDTDSFGSAVASIQIVMNETHTATACYVVPPPPLGDMIVPIVAIVVVAIVSVIAVTLFLKRRIPSARVK